MSKRLREQLCSCSHCGNVLTLRTVRKHAEEFWLELTGQWTSTTMNAYGKRLPVRPAESPWIVIARAEAAYCEEMGLPRPKYSRTLEGDLASAADEVDAAELSLEVLSSQYVPAEIAGQFVPDAEAVGDDNVPYQSLPHDHRGREAFEIGDIGTSIQFCISWSIRKL